MSLRLLSSDHLLGLHDITDPHIHPTNSLIVYVVSESVSAPKQHPRSRLWAVRTDRSDEPYPVTAEGTHATQPRWSPDGVTLGFLGTREQTETTQLFVLTQGIGEARQVTNCTGGVTGFAWGPQPGFATLMVTDPSPVGQAEREEQGRDEIVYEARHRFTRLWSCDTRTGDLTPLSSQDAQVYEFAWSPNGQDLVAVIGNEPYNWDWYAARLALLDQQTGRFETLYRSDKQFTFPVWSPDGTYIAVISGTWSDQGITGGDVLLIDRTGMARNLTAGHPRSYLSASWVEDSGRMFLRCSAVEAAESVLGRLYLDGSFASEWRDKPSIYRYGVSAIAHDLRSNDRLALVRSSPHEPGEVWTVDLAGSNTPTWVKRTGMNRAITERTLGPVETLHWTSTDGTPIHGLLIRPAVASTSGPLPLVVFIHGGPTAAWVYEFPGTKAMGWAQLLAANGFAVLMPNPRGSIGWGTEFAEGNVRDMGGGDLTDILAGVDSCVAQGIGDEQRLGVVGWSYGGYLTTWAVTQTNRFKAAVAGASITNWISFHGVSTIPGFDSVFYRSDPFDWDGRYGQFSPMAHVRNVQTPTLFLHGEQDPICPVGQAIEMWRAMKEIGVDTELVIYPREGHGMHEREHARDVLDRTVGWLKAHV